MTTKVLQDVMRVQSSFAKIYKATRLCGISENHINVQALSFDQYVPDRSLWKLVDRTNDDPEHKYELRVQLTPDVSILAVINTRDQCEMALVEEVFGPDYADKAIKLHWYFDPLPVEVQL